MRFQSWRKVMLAVASLFLGKPGLRIARNLLLRYTTFVSVSVGSGVGSP